MCIGDMGRTPLTKAVASEQQLASGAAAACTAARSAASLALVSASALSLNALTNPAHDPPTSVLPSGTQSAAYPKPKTLSDQETTSKRRMTSVHASQHRKSLCNALYC